jgi:hypothetical protein
LKVKNSKLNSFLKVVFEIQVLHLNMGFLKVKFGLAHIGIIRWRSSLANAEFMSRHLYEADFAATLLAKSARLRAVSVPNVRSEADFRLERLQAQSAGEGEHWWWLLHNLTRDLQKHIR